MKKVLYPILLAVVLILGIQIGKSWKSQGQSMIGQIGSAPNSSAAKIQNLLDLINDCYVDTVNIDSIVEATLPEIVEGLDPHSYYLNEDTKQQVTEELNGSFSGIGVQFSIEDDTIMISNVISGGPCEKKGVRAGDRIVKVDGKDFTGKDINNDKVVKTLRGKKGSKVKLGIKRNGEKNLIDFDIVRDDISISSIDVSYMITPKIGFIRVNKFGEHTYEEFMKSLLDLKGQGAEKYIVDLRDNSGGYLDQVNAMLNEFLNKGELIVYTKGRDGRSNSYANGKGVFKDVPVTVLINEWSASASEIFAGAMQDNDRGLLIGRRSFGKGLVQQQFPLDDTSAVRLTTARYYTPSGRCIQKPYKNEKDYTDEITKRYNDGEIEDPSKFKHDEKEEKFKTKKGRTVYGGGGITPDILVGLDMKGINSYYKTLSNRMLYDFAFYYSDKNRQKLTQFKTLKDLESYLSTQPLENELAEYAEKKGNIRKNSHLLAECKDLLRSNLNACIARNIMGDYGFFAIRNENDNIVKKALEQMK